jgi:hypothetical protein
MPSELPEMGKISAEVFDELIYPRLGRRRRSVLVGPKHGVDPSTGLRERPGSPSTSSARMRLLRPCGRPI